MSLVFMDWPDLLYTSHMPLQSSSTLSPGQRAALLLGSFGVVITLVGISIVLQNPLLGGLGAGLAPLLGRWNVSPSRWWYVAALVLIAGSAAVAAVTANDLLHTIAVAFGAAGFGILVSVHVTRLQYNPAAASG
jgi:hypothetical protein